MQLIVLHCPSCGVTIHVNPGGTKYFCSHCGEPVYFDNTIKREYIHRKIDETRIHESDNEKEI